MSAYRAHVMARVAIMKAARALLSEDAGASIGQIARSAEVSRATFYRQFGSRAELFEALSMERDRASRDRVLQAAADLAGRDGLIGLSMDEVAERAGVSRASVYRLFPGKPALFRALATEYSPFQLAVDALGRAGDRPPDEVLPEVLRPMVEFIARRMGLVRAILCEVTAGAPEAVEGAGTAIATFVSALGLYLDHQMTLGRLRRMNPVLAAQVVIGPLFFHLLARQTVERLAALDVPLDEVVAQLLGTGLDALRRPDPPRSPALSSGQATTMEERA